MVISAPCFSPHHPGLPAAANLSSPRSRKVGRHGLAVGCRFSPPAAATTNEAALVAADADAARVGRRRCECFDLHQQIVPYAESWNWQKSIVQRRKGLVDSEEDHSDTLITLQHQPVYTLRPSSEKKYLKFDIKDSPIEIYYVKRSGEVTYHGPGQLVMYPILNLHYQRKDTDWYLRSLEDVIIRALWSEFSIKASRIGGLTGVWVGDQKVAAIGIKVERWIIYHGLALNVTTDLTPYQHIVPCGIKDRGVGSIKEILQMASSGREFSDAVLIDRAYKSLIKEFAEVFQLSLDLSPNWNLQESNNSNKLQNI